MHQALKRLVDSNSAFEAAQRALAEAKEHRRLCALGLAEIEDEERRWDAALYAFREFGKGLSIPLAEAATGIPGRRSQSAFLVRAGRMTYQPKGRQFGSALIVEAMSEWPAPDALERDVVRSHIAHGTPYSIREGIGWGHLAVDLSPENAAIFLDDATQAIANAVGLKRSDFVEYLSTEGSVRCEGVTQRGKQCLASVAGLSSQLSISAWAAAKARGGYCNRHGG